MCARALLRLLSFRQLTRVMHYPLGRRRLSPENETKVRADVRWAIERASRYLPGNTVCFPRGLAAQAMCRRRGIDTVLYYGAKVLEGCGLQAHVWVGEGPNAVVGFENSADYHILARFPA